MRQQAVAQLGLEPRGLRRHDAAGVARPASDRRRSRDRAKTRRRPCPRSRAFRARDVPRAPPTKSIRLSVRTSPMPSSGVSTVFCRRLTSSRSGGLTSLGPAPSASVCHLPSRNIATSPFLAGVAGPSLTTYCSRSFASSDCGEYEPRSLTTRLYGNTCIWLSGKATASTVSHSPRPPLAPRNCCRARAALAAR